MSFFQFIKSRTFLIQVSIFFVLTIVLLIVINIWLKSYTKHGKYIPVPDFTGLMYNEIASFASERDLVPVIIDSVYDDSRVKGSVIGQDPPAEQLVKKNRKIYLTIVALSAEMVRMPDLSDLTLRQAIATLETYGLKAGRLHYVPHIAINAVLKQEYKGQEIAPYTLIEKGSTINLVLGRGLRDERIQVPFLLGQSRTEALKILQHSGLNMGAEFYENGANPDKAFVTRQRPLFSINAFVIYGTPIDLWYNPVADFDIDMLQQQLLQEQEEVIEEI